MPGASFPSPIALASAVKRIIKLFYREGKLESLIKKDAEPKGLEQSCCQMGKGQVTFIVRIFLST